MIYFARRTVPNRQPYLRYVRLLAWALVFALVASAAPAVSPPAEQLAREAAQAEKAGEVVRAYLLWARAALADRKNPIYWARAEALRPIAEAQSTHIDTPELETERKTHLPPGGVVGTFTQQDLEDLERMQEPPRLRPVAGKHDFDLKGNAKDLYEQVAKAYGYMVIFDSDFAPNGTIRFRVADMDYRDALHALEDATDTFIVPISENAMMVAHDDQQKRTELENDEAVAIPIPDRTSMQDAQELLTMVQQAFEMRRVVLDPQKRMILLRDRASRVDAARLVLRQLSKARAQVAVEVEFLSTGVSSSLSFGLNLPTQFPLVNFGNKLHSTAFIPAGFARFLTFGGGATFFGMGITDAQMFATASRSSADTLLRSTVVASDGQPATLHIGDKYPIVTGGYVGSGGFPGSGGGGGGTTTTYAVVTTTSYADQVSSAVSTTGKMKLVVNGLEVPFQLPAASNNLIGLQTVIESLQAGVYPTVIERGTDAKPFSLALIANSVSTSSISLIDDPDGAKIELLKPTDTASSISSAYVNADQTNVSAMGTLSLVVGTNTYPLTLASGKNNLNGLRDAINAVTDAKVTAAVLLENVTTGNVYLQVVAAATGSGDIQIYDDPDGAKKTLLNSTTEVNLAGSQLGQRVTSGSYTGNAGIGLYTPPPTFTFEDLGLILKLTPHVHNTEEVTLEVEAEYKVLGTGSINGLPIISTRKFQGQVRLRYSEWAVVAGLVTDSKTNNVSGIPGLKDIPGIGVLLRQNTKSSEKSNLLIVLKPHLMSLPPGEFLTRSIWVGSETRPLSPL